MGTGHGWLSEHAWADTEPDVHAAEHAAERWARDALRAERAERSAEDEVQRTLFSPRPSFIQRWALHYRIARHRFGCLAAARMAWRTARS